jgi:hypothetical protein
MSTATALQAYSLDAAGAAVALDKPLTFSIPIEDTAEFHTALDEKWRIRVQLTLRLLERVDLLHGAGNFVRATDELATSYRHVRGLSGPRLRIKYSAYRDAGGDWRTLVPNYKPPQKQPPEFVTFVKKLIEDNHRSTKAALRVLRDQLWAAGEPVPGYGTWMEWYVRTWPGQALPKHFPRLYPSGWSVRNLRRYAPSKGELALVRQGFKAAKRFFPNVTRDPSQLRPMELIVIDDFETDVLTAFLGDDLYKPQICRTAGLLAIDVGTRRKLAFGLKPRLERADGTRMGIKRRDVRSILYALFLKHGLPDYPVTILVENATAAITPDFELALTTLFDGRIRIARTGLVNHRTLTNGFLEGGGRPWEKGWIESEFNYIWNEAGAMRGYKGSRYDNAPGELEQRILYAEHLLSQGDRKTDLNLPPEKLSLVRMPFQNLNEATDAFGRIFDRCDCRTDHKMLGFDRITEFRLEAHEAPKPWSQLALLSPAQQQQAELITRMEAPIERWERLSARHPRQSVPDSVLALLLLTPKQAVFKNQAITFTHKGEGEARGYAFVDPEGTVLAGITEGTELLGYFDEDNAVELHVTDLKGGFIGTLTRLGGNRGMVDIRDKAALGAAGEITQRIFNRTLGVVRERHAGEDRQLAADRVHNDAIVAAHRAEMAAAPAAQRLASGFATAVVRRDEARAEERSLRRARDESDELLTETAPAPGAKVPDLPAEDLL